jgi:poly-gamma-glutamate synthesis protein (capsule biosynthesis protein)
VQRAPVYLSLALLAALLAAAPAGGTAPPAARPVVLWAGGDVMPVMATAGVIAARGPDHVFAELAPLLRRGDLAFVNMESPLTGRGGPTEGKLQEDLRTGRDYVFRGSPLVAGALRRAGVLTVSVANNHAMDYGATGLLDTIAQLKRAGVAAVGGGATLADARRPHIVDVRGTRVAFLAYSDILPRGSVATATTPGIAPAKGYWTGRPAEDEMIADIRAARGSADHVVVSFHWGDEMRTLPNCRQVALGRRALAAGATVVLGHHPHVLQPVVTRGNRLIAYSLGNLISSPRSQVARESAVLRIELGPEGVSAWEALPLVLTGGQPRAAGAETGAAIRERLARPVWCRSSNRAAP